MFERTYLGRWWQPALLISCLGASAGVVAQAPDPGLIGLPIVTPPPVVGDVDNNGVVTCRDIALAAKAIGKHLDQTGYMPRADIDGNGVIDVRDISAISRRLPAGSICQGVTTYIIVEGHDGSADPDDNLAQQNEYMAITRNSQKNSRVAHGGSIWGDTTTARRATMLSGSDAVSHANYQFHLLYVVPALVSVGADINKLLDVVYQAAFNYTPTSRSAITTGGQLLYDYVKSAIDAHGLERVVYTAGGGQNTAAEAIALLRHDGYSDDDIFAHFAIIQHGTFNTVTATEVPAKDITFPFTIRIDDQNGNATPGSNFRARSGPSGCTATAELGCFLLGR